MRDLEAADVAVLKVQPLGGVRACLRIAEDIGLPVVVSSALETSVGIATGLALAAALPELPFACGLATVQLLTDDVAVDPLLPVDGTLPVGAPPRRRGRARPARGGARAGRPLAGPLRRGPVPAPGEVPDERSTELARAVVQRLLDEGVTEVVVAPGQPQRPAVLRRLRRRRGRAGAAAHPLDERSAGFLALGPDQAGPPGRGVCTSGTAVANLHPAVLEAAHAGVPLVVVTADRPARLRGTGANQTTDQVGVFGALVASYDVTDATVPAACRDRDVAGAPQRAARRPAARRRRPGRRARPRRGRGAPGPRPSATVLPLGPRTVVVAGDDAGPSARKLAERAGWPLLAEPSSGSRTGDLALRCYRLLLRRPREPDALGPQIERVVVLGRPTLSRPVTRLLGRDDVEVVAVPTAGVWTERPFPVGLEAPLPDRRRSRHRQRGLARALARRRPGRRRDVSTRCWPPRPT